MDKNKTTLDSSTQPETFAENLECTDCKIDNEAVANAERLADDMCAQEQTINS